MRTSLLLSSLLVLVLSGCPGPSGSGDCAVGLVCLDSGSAADTGTAIDAATDTGVAPGDDSGTPGDDSGTPGDDSGTTTDSGTPGDDSGTVTDAGGGPCVEPGLGDSCGDTAGGAPCPSGFTCDLGRCLPQDRETCGGFAGAPCDDPAHDQCVYQPGHGDVGTCLSRSELTCLCSIDSSRWTCD